MDKVNKNNTKVSEKQQQAEKLLDEMTNLLLSGDEIAFSDLILDWYRMDLECSSVSLPVDIDELRLAIKASLLERLTEVLNSPPHNGSQKTPQWCKGIGALSHPVRLQSDRLLEDEQYCKAFQKRNLLVVSNFMFFI
ncbi:hypothetical protein [Aliikangiella maris]|uniref:Uncharacterized protein n=2 Tax=Aliikangiella maris TaxID=3162458 RepID=A0ABV3MNP5_9GAMM